MVLSPDIQKKAQEEIDRVIGSDRLPSFADKSSLPYISCIVWECLRWNPVAPMGGAHFTTKDDQYNGYQIPKGSTVMANVWYDTNIQGQDGLSDFSFRAILHDEQTYPHPLKFDPDRFENQEKNRLAGINELPQAAFGFGRRFELYFGP